MQLADFAPLISLATLVFVFSVVASGFLNFGTLTLILEQGSVLAIAATGLTFVLLCAEIDLSVGNMALMAGCLSGVLWESTFAAGPKEILGAAKVSAFVTFLAVVVPIAVAIVLGLVSGWLTVSSGLPSFIITLTMMNISLGLAKFMTTGGTFKMPPVLKNIWSSPIFEIGFGRLGTFSCPWSAAIALFVMMIAHLVLQHTRFGRYVYMTGGNRQAARLAGVQTDRIVIACLAICACTAAFGGMVNAGRMGSVSLDQNSDLLLDAVACVVLGGTSLFGGEGSIGRTLVGVLSFTTLKVGLILTNIERLIKSTPLPGVLKESLLKASWVKDFEFLRPFVLGTILLLALVIHGRLIKHRSKA